MAVIPSLPLVLRFRVALEPIKIVIGQTTRLRNQVICNFSEEDSQILFFQLTKAAMSQPVLFRRYTVGELLFCWEAMSEPVPDSVTHMINQPVTVGHYDDLLNLGIVLDDRESNVRGTTSCDNGCSFLRLWGVAD